MDWLPIEREKHIDIQLDNATLKIISGNKRLESLQAYNIELSADIIYQRILDSKHYAECHRSPITGSLYISVSTADEKQLQEVLLNMSEGKTFVFMDPNSDRIDTFEDVYVTESSYIEDLKYYIVKVVGHRYHMSTKEGAGYVY